MAVVAPIESIISVYIPDESLHHIVPHGRFSFDNEESLAIDTAGLTPLQNLIRDVRMAIELQPGAKQTDNA